MNEFKKIEAKSRRYPSWISWLLALLDRKILTLNHNHRAKSLAAKKHFHYGKIQRHRKSQQSRYDLLPYPKKTTIKGIIKLVGFSMSVSTYIKLNHFEGY